MVLRINLKEEIGIASRCPGTLKMLVGFATLLTYQHIEPTGALGPPEDAQETCPTSVKMEKGQRYLSSSFPSLALC